MLGRRAYCVARFGKPYFPAFRPVSATWHRVDFVAHSCGTASPFGTNQLRLAIDTTDPKYVSVHWDDDANLGVVKRIRRPEGEDPILLALSEAPEGYWTKAPAPGGNDLCVVPGKDSFVHLWSHAGQGRERLFCSGTCGERVRRECFS